MPHICGEQLLPCDSFFALCDRQYENIGIFLSAYLVVDIFK